MDVRKFADGKLPHERRAMPSRNRFEKKLCGTGSVIFSLTVQKEYVILFTKCKGKFYSGVLYAVTTEDMCGKAGLMIRGVYASYGYFKYAENLIKGLCIFGIYGSATQFTNNRIVGGYVL